MGDIEDRLNSILSSPEEMEKIMGLARQFMGTAQAPEQDNTQAKAVSNVTPPPDMDPRLMSVIGRLFNEYSRTDNDRTAVLNAIKPYLRDERRRKLEKAIEMAKMARIARLAIREFSSGQEGR
ncbi:MAG: hypothetical protein IJG63_06440 [Oscillospiraceae bacterium]|nr:hypothetical protein [Oscillospiraceae bacterium]